MYPTPSRPSDAGPEPQPIHDEPLAYGDGLRVLYGQDAARRIHRIACHLQDVGRQSYEVRNYSAIEWESVLRDMGNYENALTVAQAAAVESLLEELEAERRAEQEREDAEMMETGADRCPPRE